MRVSSHSLGGISEQLGSSTGLCLTAGAFTIRIQSRIASFAQLLYSLYYDFPVADSGGLADFHVRLDRPSTLRYFWHPHAEFKIDGLKPFDPFPLDLVFPLFEWGANWCIAKRCHHFLMLHAGVVEKNGRAIILPAYPGSGKSTLCAALILRGWRLLSDEFGLVDPKSGELFALPRPIPLKNESIEVIRQFSSEAFLGPLFPNTRKGTVAHMRAPTSSVLRLSETAIAKWIIFPKFRPDSELQFNQLPKAYSFLKLATNAFNYDLLGLQGFKAVRKIINSCDCYNLTYSNLNEVVAHLDHLVAA